MKRWIDVYMYVCMDGRMDGWMDGQIDGWMLFEQDNWNNGDGLSDLSFENQRIYVQQFR